MGICSLPPFFRTTLKLISRPQFLIQQKGSETDWIRNWYLHTLLHKISLGSLWSNFLSTWRPKLLQHDGNSFLLMWSHVMSILWKSCNHVGWQSQLTIILSLIESELQVSWHLLFPEHLKYFWTEASLPQVYYNMEMSNQLVSSCRNTFLRIAFTIFCWTLFTIALYFLLRI